MSGGKASRWIPEPEAVQHICEITGFDETDAKRDLRGHIIAGDVEVRARRAEFKPAEGEDPDWLRSNELLRGHLSYGHVIEWTDDHIVISEDSQKEATGRPTGRIVATGIELSRLDLLRLWPDERDNGQATPLARPRGGRPTKYDWAAASGFLSRYVVDNDPSKTEAARALRDWFRNREQAPDFRDLERMVDEAFKSGKTG
ncbi:hypothetical protein [Sinorhizobium fredii]|uniref:hypothetical protein n=1 Tax=Rhizobium fredii TaxID=380 RepID=UPI000CF1F6C1|nr:hypothetical protein [Sinorhizobium fredii]